MHAGPSQHHGEQPHQAQEGRLEVNITKIYLKSAYFLICFRLFRTPVHRMELNRIRFIINSYLRIRLEKIQRNIHKVTQDKIGDDNPDR